MVDIHQHLWPEELLHALSRRSAPPRLSDGWLELPGEPPVRFDPAAHDPAGRVGDRILIAPSLPSGFDAELSAAHDRGVLALGAPFGLWASGERVDSAVGVCIAGRDLPASDALLRELDVPLFVHPGPASGSPPWFPALTAYVAELHEAWMWWAAFGRERYPTLKVVFAMLAGLAPLHAERLAARGGPAEAVHDPLTFFDTSSYGPRAIDAMLRVVGVDRLLYGSDVPVVEPVSLAPLGEAVIHALTVANPERIL